MEQLNFGKMDEKEKIKQNIQDYIKEHPEEFPFIAQFWDIHVEDINKPKPNYLEFGKYNSKLTRSYPFYKPYSKLIDLSKIEE
ncbi:MAG: hypothetical protein R2831_04110 [Chitinophagaceae bacterium]